MKSAEDVFLTIEKLLEQNPLEGGGSIPKDGVPIEHIESYMGGRGYDAIVSEREIDRYMVWQQRGGS